MAFSYFFPCARCYNCLRGEFGACKFRMGRKPLEEWPVCNGGFAQYYYLRAPQYLFRLPDNIPNACAAPINCANAGQFVSVVGLSIPSGHSRPAMISLPT